jgi:hypothetical protein
MAQKLHLLQLFHIVSIPKKYEVETKTRSTFFSAPRASTPQRPPSASPHTLLTHSIFAPTIFFHETLPPAAVVHLARLPTRSPTPPPPHPRTARRRPARRGVARIRNNARAFAHSPICAPSPRRPPSPPLPLCSIASLTPTSRFPVLYRCRLLLLLPPLYSSVLPPYQSPNPPICQPQSGDSRS